MAKYSECVYDDIGKSYKRKNQYLEEVAHLQKQMSEDPPNKENYHGQLSALLKNKDQHPYNIALKAYKAKEKVFLETLNVRKKDFAGKLEKELPRKIRALKLRGFESSEKIAFYEAYQELTYDAKLIFEESKLIARQVPEIIAFLDQRGKELEMAAKAKGAQSPEQEQAFKDAYQAFKKVQQELLSDGKSKLKEKRKSGMISAKALKNGIVELKKKRKEALSVKALDSQSKANRELTRSVKFDLKTGAKRRIEVLSGDLADLKRKTPLELPKTKPVLAYLTFLLPGLGQLINRQFIKTIPFALASFFIYFAAFPYALGFGNYQGKGISGLIKLAEGGSRVDKSLIFMIEGILAIFLVVFAIVLLYISFRDVLKVEKDMIKGIRPRNWYETWKAIGEEGFPYFVSLPALVVIVFIVIVPITTAILLSFTGMDPQHQSKFGWVGIQNYKLIAMGQGLAGSVFWSILVWTLIWTLAATSLAIFLGFALALLSNNERIKGKTFFRMIYLLPWAVPGFITIMFFSIMMAPDGIMTNIVSAIAGNSINIKTDPVNSRVALVLIQGWLGSAYIFMLSTGVLQAIPEDLYEAAQIDGATEWQKVMKITVPIVLFQTAPLLVGQYTFNFNNFSMIYLFNSGGPFNPTKYGNLAGSTDILISYIFKLTMDNQYQAIGAAITVVISMGLMFFAFLGFRNTKAFKDERL